jgi:uncharacterized Ntn-hydrolase superfamily protein
VTFSLLARCAATGQLGAAVTTSDLAVGARVPHALAGVGAAVTQHRTDPRLGPAMLEALRAGAPAGGAVAGVAAATEHRAWRQLGAVDATGATAAFTGSLVTPLAAELRGRDCLAIGNMLVDDGVAPAIVAAFERAAGPLAARLLAGLAAGERAGGESGRLRSAALLVVERAPFPLVDLRVDAADEPLDALAALWREYEPYAPFVLARALDPDGAGHGPSSTTTSGPERRAG